MGSQRLKRTIFTAIFVLLLGVINGCSIKQTIKPVALTGQPMELCIIKNSKVSRREFLDTYMATVAAKPIKVRTLSDDASISDCPTTSTYTANYRWDFAWYLWYAEIKVYRNAALVGEAIYDVTWGGLRLDKWADIEDKIRELVDELFPTGKTRILTTTPSNSAAPILGQRVMALGEQQSGPALAAPKPVIIDVVTKPTRHHAVLIHTKGQLVTTPPTALNAEYFDNGSGSGTSRLVFPGNQFWEGEFKLLPHQESFKGIFKPRLLDPDKIVPGTNSAQKGFAMYADPTGTINGMRVFDVQCGAH